MAKTRRKYKGNATSTTISAGLASGATSAVIASGTGWPTTGPFYCVVDPGTSTEEKILVGSISGTTISSITRGVDDTTDQNHASGCTIYPVFTAIDADEANELTSTYSAQGHIVYQGASTFTGLAIGTAGQVLKVNSGATAPEWGQVPTAGIADDAVTAAKIAAGAVGASEIADGSVGTTELADSSVTSAKIAAGAVTAAKIGVLTNTTAKTGDYTLALGDENTTILMDKATAVTVTIPTNSSVAFAVGTQISFVQTGAGQVTFSGASGVTLNSDTSKTKILVRYGVASLIKTATDTWVLFGQLTA